MRKRLKKVSTTSNVKTATHISKEYEISRNYGITKRKVYSSSIELQDTEYCSLTSKEFKIALLKKLNKL